MLCRRGNVSRQDIGAIRIFDRETKVEIRPDLAQHFARSVQATAGVGSVAIEPVNDEGGPAQRERTKGRPKDRAASPAKPKHRKRSEG
jgi:ATP-dependent RNA helicase DeaD